MRPGRCTSGEGGAPLTRQPPPAKKLYKLNDDYLYTLDRESTTNSMGYPMCAQLFRSVSLVSSSNPALLRRFLYSEFKVQQAAYDMQGGQAYFDA